MPDELENATSEVASVPETTVHIAQAGANNSIDAMKELAGSINSALTELTTVQRELLEHLKAAKEDVTSTVEDPSPPLPDTPTVPEIVEPEIVQPQTRTIRRNGRKVKRNA